MDETLPPPSRPVFVAGTLWAPITPADDSALAFVKALPQAWPFAVPFLSILLAHEFGHYFAARAHRVEASLPYFIPLPVVSPLGTMGAVISMKGRIRSRNALLDIGACGLRMPSGASGFRSNMSMCDGPPHWKRNSTDFALAFTPFALLAASAASSLGNVSPSRPSPPTLMAQRREKRV